MLLQEVPSMCGRQIYRLHAHCTQALRRVVADSQWRGPRVADEVPQASIGVVVVAGTLSPLPSVFEHLSHARRGGIPRRPVEWFHTNEPCTPVVMQTLPDHLARCAQRTDRDCSVSESNVRSMTCVAIEHYHGCVGSEVPTAKWIVCVYAASFSVPHHLLGS
jgi:hypothetical protein